MLAKLKADAVAVKNYVVANYKQLGAAVLVGKFGTTLVVAAVALVKAL
jgi:hypothetical protein